jgi:hypothetical protein
VRRPCIKPISLKNDNDMFLIHITISKHNPT